MSRVEATVDGLSVDVFKAAISGEIDLTDQDGRELALEEGGMLVLTFNTNGAKYKISAAGEVKRTITLKGEEIRLVRHPATKQRLSEELGFEEELVLPLPPIAGEITLAGQPAQYVHPDGVREPETRGLIDPGTGEILDMAGLLEHCRTPEPKLTPERALKVVETLQQEVVDLEAQEAADDEAADEDDEVAPWDREPTDTQRSPSLPADLNELPDMTPHGTTERVGRVTSGDPLLQRFLEA